MTEILPAVEIESPSGVKVNASIIWLHGLGADGSDFAPIVPQLNLPTEFGIRFVLDSRSEFDGHEEAEKWSRRAAWLGCGTCSPE